VLGDADKMHQQMGWPSRSWTLLAPAVICTTAAALLVSRISRSSSVSLRGWLRGWWWLRQRWLRTQLIERDLIDVGSVRLIGGADISFIKGSETDACAALVVVAADSLEVVHSVCRRVVLTSPYIPGYLAFREAPFLVSLLDELRRTAPHLLPEVILIDGNGILHPNRFGLACHLGVQTGIPTIGVGKSLHHVDGLDKDRMRALSEQCHARGDYALLVGDSGATWGALLRTSEPVADAFRPVVVSVGHGITLDSALALVRRCARHRIPEPVRQADLRSRQWLRENGAA